MSHPMNVHGWTSPLTEEIIAREVALALRVEHAQTDAVVKRIARATGVSSLTIRKWYEGRNTPKASHLIQLAQTYPAVRTLLLGWLGVGDNLHPEPTPQKYVDKGHFPEIYTDRFVGINVQVPLELRGKMNERQLWFLGQLQQHRTVRAHDIHCTWGVTLRSAERDIAQLVVTGVVVYHGSRKAGEYLIQSKNQIIFEKFSKMQQPKNRSPK